MTGPRWIRTALSAIVATSAFVVFTGGVALAVLRAADPESALLPALLPVYQQLLVALVATAALGVAYAVIERTGRSDAARPEPVPAPSPPAPSAPAQRETPPPGLADLFQQMRTYVDLEMWELALDKANRILRDHSGSREAEAVSRNINELRWKAEPKFVARAAAVSDDEQRTLQEKGLAAMLKHVKTYMELEMWELARQKALAILKHFPDSREAAEVLPLYRQIEERAPAPTTETK